MATILIFRVGKKVKVLVTQSCLTLCKSTDCTTPGSSVHEIFQARILEWVAIPFSRESSRPKVQTWDSRTAGRFFTIWATREALLESNIVIFSSVSEGNSYSFFSFLFFKSRTNHELLCQVLRAYTSCGASSPRVSLQPFFRLCSMMPSWFSFPQPFSPAAPLASSSAGVTFILGVSVPAWRFMVVGV